MVRLTGPVRCSEEQGSQPRTMELRRRPTFVRLPGTKQNGVCLCDTCAAATDGGGFLVMRNG